MARTLSLADIRTRALESAIRAEIEAYLKAQKLEVDFARRCAWCGQEFSPRQRFHFFDKPICRRAWYAGQFRPQPKTKKERAA